MVGYLLALSPLLLLRAGSLMHHELKDKELLDRIIILDTVKDWIMMFDYESVDTTVICLC